jgi:chromosome segregation ATPase
MSELRQEVLQAEAAIRQLAEEIARAKNIADNVEEVRRRLNEAANLLERSRKAMEEVQEPLKKVTEALSHRVEELSRSAQDLSSKLTQALGDFGDRVRQTIQQAYQDMQTQLTAAIGEAQKALSDAANSLADLQTNFENQMNTLLRQNEQLLQHMATQDKEIKRLLRLLTLCLIFSITSTIGITILVLLLIQAK